MSVEDVINYKPSEEEDYYALLSCDESATVRQIFCVFLSTQTCFLQRFLIFFGGWGWVLIVTDNGVVQREIEIEIFGGE